MGKRAENVPEYVAGQEVVGGGGGNSSPSLLFPAAGKAHSLAEDDDEGIPAQVGITRGSFEQDEKIDEQRQGMARRNRRVLENDDLISKTLGEIMHFRGYTPDDIRPDYGNYRFSRYYPDSRVFIDKFDADRDTIREAVVEKCQTIALWNKTHPDHKYGYLPLFMGDDVDEKIVGRIRGTKEGNIYNLPRRIEEM